VSTEPGASENYSDVSFKRIETAIDKIPADDSGAVMFYKASRDLFDSPESAIRDLMVAAELRWRGSSLKGTDNVLASAYRSALRGRLSEDFANYLARVRSVGSAADLPEDCSYRQLSQWDWPAEKHYTALLQYLTSRPCFDDPLTMYRLRELTSWYPAKSSSGNDLAGLAQSHHETGDLLTLARGVRNSATHFAEAGDELYGVMLYLARVLVEAFTACLTRDTAA
jgi:hypothetical protein